MHVAGISLDLNPFLQFIFTAFLVALGLLYLIKNTASKYFEVDASFEGAHHNTMPGLRLDESCVVCGASGSKKCSRCKEARYCSQECQTKHWKYGHKEKCKVYSTSNHGSKASGFGVKNSNAVALVPVTGTSRLIKPSKKILFPYDEFVKLFNWDKPGFPPCGLVNCGNSCFANVVLQCLSYTRPLVAYLLEKGHRRECRRNDWCFFCEFQTHVERAHQSLHPFSPISILSRLPNIGGNLGYGRQEDAHELMRFAIDTMQSVCLDEFGGEKSVDPSSQQTTLIQHIFGGHLQSQVICTKCNKISNQYENMMDLTVEIHGDVASLEECLDQFTVKEWLHGENMYKCDGCNDYVKAWKRLTVRRAPNILTIALKRFQSGRFGKLNKRVIFPETLDLSPYMSEMGDGTDVYKLYSVVVHVDMLNASFFGHYICYIKDFCGNWYKIDDCKVTAVELDEVLSQGAYMLLYSRVCARESCLRTTEPSTMEQHRVKVEVEPWPTEQGEHRDILESINPISRSGSVPCDTDASSKVSSCNGNMERYSNSGREDFEEMDVVSLEASPSILKEGSSPKNKFSGNNSQATDEDEQDVDIVNYNLSKCEKASSSAQEITIVGSNALSSAHLNDSGDERDSHVAIDSKTREDSVHTDMANGKDIVPLYNRHAQEIGSPVEYTFQPVSSIIPSSISQDDDENGNEIESKDMMDVDIDSLDTLSSAQNGEYTHQKDSSVANNSEVAREDLEYMDTDNTIHCNGHAQKLVSGLLPSSNGTSSVHKKDAGDGNEANRIEITNGISH